MEQFLNIVWKEILPAIKFNRNKISKACFTHIFQNDSLRIMTETVKQLWMQILHYTITKSFEMTPGRLYLNHMDQDDAVANTYWNTIECSHQAGMKAFLLHPYNWSWLLKPFQVFFIQPRQRKQLFWLIILLVVIKFNP